MTREALIKRLRKGWLSSAQAFTEFGTLKLTSRISELRKHHMGVHLLAIEQRTVRKNGKSWCEYRIAR